MDWNRIRRDYIAGKGSYRELAAKYGVPYRTLADRAKAEKWVELRNQSRAKAASKTVEAVAEANSRIDTRIYGAADRLLGILERSMEELDARVITKRFKVKTETLETVTEYRSIEREQQAPIDRAGLRQLTGALAELKDILDVRCALDEEEQRARIEKLRAEADRGKDEGGKEIAITLGGAEEWAK